MHFFKCQKTYISYLYFTCMSFLYFFPSYIYLLTMLSVTYNAFLHIPCTFIYVLYYLYAITFMPSNLLLVAIDTLFHIHTFINSTLFSSFFHLQWFQYFFLRYIEKKHTTTMQFINKCFSLHVIDLLHLSSHVFILFYIFPFFKHFPSLYVPWKQKLPCPTYNILFL